MAETALMNTYQRLNISFESGQGAWLFDAEGNKYLDALSGLGVCALGHAHPAVTRAITEQANKLLHTSNLYQIETQEQLATKLIHAAGMDSVFFSNSGAEANEAAIKLARLYAHSRQIDNPVIIVLENAFHGRTMATLTASGNRKIQAGFEPLVSGFSRAPYDDIDALRTIANNNPKVVAVLLEPIQGEGGIRVPDEGFLAAVREFCNEHHLLMMLDEVQSGNGRSGRYFAYQHSNIYPDVLTTAKGLANGVPIGACLAKGEAATLFQPGNHGSTFGGNPLACAAALAVLSTIEQEDLCQRAADLGEHFCKAFRSRLGACDHVVDIRGKGLMIGIELDKPCAALVQQAMDRGLLINVTADKVVRLLPPLILSDAEAEQIIATTSEIIANF